MLTSISGRIDLCREDNPIDSQSLTRYMRDRGGYIWSKLGPGMYEPDVQLHVSHILILRIGGIDSQEVHVYCFHVLAARSGEQRVECGKAPLVPLKCIKLVDEYVK